MSDQHPGSGREGPPTGGPSSGTTPGGWAVPGGATPPTGPPPAGPPPAGPPPGFGPPPGAGPPPGQGPPPPGWPGSPPPRKGRTGLVLGLVGGGLVAVVVLLVLAVTLLGTSEEPERVVRSEVPIGRDEAGGGPPGLEDHWHAAYGVNVCGAWLPDLADVGPSTTGIHTHADGIVHVHPFTPRAAGDRARFGLFLEAVGFEPDEPGFLDGFLPTAARDGTCGGEAASWTLVRFDPDAYGDEPVAVVDDPDDIPDVRFEANRQAYVLAFLPEGELPPPPPSLAYLDRVSPPAR